jgi:hypothetical protein
LELLELDLAATCLLKTRNKKHDFRLHYSWLLL